MKAKNISPVLFVTFALILSACKPLLTPPPPSPTPAPTTIPEPTDPASVVLAFWDAMNNQDFDAAMSLVAEDIQVVGPGMKYTGKDTFRIDLKSRMAGIRYVVSDLVVTGDTVTYNWQYFYNGALGGSGTGESMVVKNGKIVQFNAT